MENEPIPEKRNSADFPPVYMRLRTTLDCLEITAMRYCLKDADEKRRITRAEELEKALMPLIRKYEKRMKESNPPPADCPDGFCLCDGCCVPYPCP